MSGTDVAYGPTSSNPHPRKDYGDLFRQYPVLITCMFITAITLEHSLLRVQFTRGGVPSAGAWGACQRVRAVVLPTCSIIARLVPTIRVASSQPLYGSMTVVREAALRSGTEAVGCCN
eukprot:1033251-Rhodomonas_salina.2